MNGSNSSIDGAATGDLSRLDASISRKGGGDDTGRGATIAIFNSGRPSGRPDWFDYSDDEQVPARAGGVTADNATPNLSHSMSPSKSVRDVSEESSTRDEEDRESLSPSPLPCEDQKDDLSQTEILEAFSKSFDLQCFERMVAGILGFWMLFPFLREKVNPRILKKILGLITDEHKPPLPEESMRQHSKELYAPGSRFPHRYHNLLGILKKYGVMGYELRNLTNTIVGLLFGTLNPFLVSNFIEHIQQVDISQENVKTTLVFTLLFLYSVMRNTVLVKKPEQLYSFVQFLLANFNKDNASWLDLLNQSNYDKDFLAAIRVVSGKVFDDFKSIPNGKPLTEAQMEKFVKETEELALPDTEDKTNTSQKLLDSEIPEALVEAYERHWFTLQNIVRRLLLSHGDPLFEFTGDFSKHARFFLFLTLLTSSCRRSSTIFQKELEKVLRAFQDVKQKKQRIDVFDKDFLTPASKLFILIRLVFLEESDDFINQFFEFDSQGNKRVQTATSLPECLSDLLDKMHKIAEFRVPVYQSMKVRISKIFPDASVAAACGGVSAHEGPRFRPGNAKKSALKQSSSDPATASIFTADALRAHTESQSKLAQQLVTIGITTPEASMALAAKFNEAGINFLKTDLKDLSKEEVAETLKQVSVTLTPVQLNKLMKHVNEE